MVPSQINAKCVHREKILVEQASEHIGRTLQRFHDESALFSCSILSIEDSAALDMRQEEMAALQRYISAAKEVVDAKKQIDDEASIREADDKVILDSILETQHLLQMTVRMLVSSVTEYDMFVVDSRALRNGGRVHGCW